MAKATGFLEYPAKHNQGEEPLHRIRHFNEFHTPLSMEERRKQAARCMDCGVPFCQSGEMLFGMTSGCPLHNLVPEMNDLVYHGNLKQAYFRLSKTHSLPEFTARVCPALCEAACTCAAAEGAVCTKDNELAVIEYAYENGLVTPDLPFTKTGKSIGIVGSGPAGLAAAIWLNRRGHTVTVYEQQPLPGGLLRYGIPNMKLDKRIIDRRIQQMEASGIVFVCNTRIGRDISTVQLCKRHDRILLAIGAGVPRDINVPGRDSANIFFTVDFLSDITKKLEHSDYEPVSSDLVKDKNVLVIGGGDTGNDCVGTCVRLGAKSIVQLEMMPCLPEARSADNLWPQWPRVKKTDYGQQEAAAVYGSDPRIYQTTVQRFLSDENGNVHAAVTVSLEAKKGEDGRLHMTPVPGTEREIPCELVLIAAGFTGCEELLPKQLGIEMGPRGTIPTEQKTYETSTQHVFAAGDARRGQSLVVWAIAEGRATARDVDEYLTGYRSL